MIYIKRKTALTLLLIIFLILSAWIFTEFLSAIILGAFLTFIFSPLQERFTFIKNPDYRAGILTLFTIIILVFSFFLITQAFILKVDTSIITIQKFARGEVLDCQGDFLCDIVVKFRDLRQDVVAQEYFSELVNPRSETGKSIVSNTVSSASKVIFLLPDVILFLFLTFLSMWYFLANRNNIYNTLCSLSPLRGEDTKLLFENFNNLIKGFIFGFLLTALCQSVVSGIAYYFAGFSNPVVFGVLTGLLGGIPILGTGIVWVPLLLYKIIVGVSSGTPYLFSAIIILIAGIIVSSVDNIIKPKVMANLVYVDVYFIIFGVIGGVSLFGISGIIIGPFIILITYNLIKIYLKAKGKKHVL